MKKYQVLQGKISRSGHGDYDLMAEFDKLEDAKDFFNEIKEDKRGYTFNNNAGEHLETILIENENIEDPIGYWSCD